MPRKYQNIKGAVALSARIKPTLGGMPLLKTNIAFAGIHSDLFFALINPAFLSSSLMERRISSLFISCSKGSPLHEHDAVLRLTPLPVENQFFLLTLK